MASVGVGGYGVVWRCGECGSGSVCAVRSQHACTSRVPNTTQLNIRCTHTHSQEHQAITLPPPPPPPPLSHPPRRPNSAPTFPLCGGRMCRIIPSSYDARKIPKTHTPPHARQPRSERTSSQQPPSTASSTRKPTSTATASPTTRGRRRRRRRRRPHFMCAQGLTHARVSTRARAHLRAPPAQHIHPGRTAPHQPFGTYARLHASAHPHASAHSHTHITRSLSGRTVGEQCGGGRVVGGC